MDVKIKFLGIDEVKELKGIVKTAELYTACQCGSQCYKMTFESGQVVFSMRWNISGVISILLGIGLN